MAEVLVQGLLCVSDRLIVTKRRLISARAASFIEFVNSNIWHLLLGLKLNARRLATSRPQEFQDRIAKRAK